MQTLVAIGMLYCLAIIACGSLAAIDLAMERLLPRITIRARAFLIAPLLGTMAGLTITISWKLLSALLPANPALVATACFGIYIAALGAWFLLCIYTGNRPFILRK